MSGFQLSEYYLALISEAHQPIRAPGLKSRLCPCWSLGHHFTISPLSLVSNAHIP